MLKRNGENCEHPVPNYPGLLTTSEFKAYNVAVPLVAVEVRLFNERATTLSEIEKQSAGTAEQVAAQSTHGLQSLTVKGTPEAAFGKSAKFCSSRREARCCFVRAMLMVKNNLASSRNSIPIHLTLVFTATRICK